MGSHIQRNSILIIFVVLLLLVVSGTYLFLRKVVHTADVPPSVMTETKSGAGNSSESAAASANIIVSSPTSGAAVQLPMIITGQARVFESVVSYRIIDEKGTTLSSGNTMANSPDAGEFGPFTITIKDLGEFTGGKMSIVVYQSSAKDGSEIDLVSVPVILQ